MNGPGLRVPRVRGEEARRRLAAEGFLDVQWEILKEGEFLVFPLTANGPPPGGWGEVVDREFAPVARSLPTDYRELLDWSPETKSELPRSFDVVGDIVLVRVPRSLEARRAEIGAALLSFVPGARVVGADRGVHGPERRREVESIAGHGPWRTRHRENGLELDVDLERAYFSPRLAREHQRVAEEVRAGDRVYDLCCGVGPFSVTIARDGRARAITAIDLNPAAIEMLRATLRRYPFGSKVEAIEERLESFAPRAEPRERVILNLPHEGIKYLPLVARTVAPGGRLYYYEVAARDELENRSEVVVGALGPQEHWRVVDRHVVHPYSPTSDLTAWVVERSER
ncbi:MAG: methyltransferase domain-containing protein [Thermoplasmata archaeon]|jgi:tRNA (guanine37-N1)-methyltransferase